MVDFITISLILEHIPRITLLKHSGGVPLLMCIFHKSCISVYLTHQRVLRVAAAADRTVGFPLFSYLLSFLQCDRYRKNALVESKISIHFAYIII